VGKRNGGSGLADPAFLIGNANDFGGHKMDFLEWVMD